MSLKITLKPNEVFVVNGCVMKNSARRHTMIIENYADIIRGADLIDEEEATTPLKKIYFLIQTAFLDPRYRENLIPVIHEQLAAVHKIFSAQVQSNIMECANYLSVGDYYKALAILRPAIKYEKQLLDFRQRS